MNTGLDSKDSNTKSTLKSKRDLSKEFNIEEQKASKKGNKVKKNNETKHS